MTKAACFFTIWTAPRRTMRRILDEYPGFAVWPLAMIGGIAQTLDQNTLSTAAHQLHLPLAREWLLTTILLTGAVFGLLGLYVNGFLFGRAGRLLKGTGTDAEVRAALAWSNVPLIPQVLFFLAAYPVLIDVWLANPPAAAPENLQLLIRVSGLVLILTSGWSIVLVMLNLAEAHRFAWWRALLSTLLVILVMGLILGTGFLLMTLWELIRLLSPL